MLDVPSQTQVELPSTVEETKKGYRVEFALTHGGSVRTPWLSVMGPRAPALPFLDVTLHADGPEILRVEASAKQLPSEDAWRHQDVMLRWLNDTAWPKELVVRWRWVDDASAAEERAYGTALALCVALALAFIAKALLPERRRVASLFGEAARSVQEKAD